MEKGVYFNQRKNIQKKIFSELSIWDNPILMDKFNIVSAALLNYLPGLDYSKHENVFKGIMLYQKLSILEQAYPQITELTELEGFNESLFDIINGHAAILCTFHTGSYRILNHYLLKHNVNFTLVAAKAVLQQQTEDLRTLHSKLYAHNTSMFNIIDAESPHSLLQMIRELKKGNKLLFYIDGNTGVELKNEKEGTLCNINFLNQKLYARKGIGYLSYLTQSPIYVFGSYRKSINQNKLKLFNKINPISDISKDEYSLTATQTIYNSLETIVKKYPEQWEGWLYIQSSMNLVNKLPDSLVTSRKCDGSDSVYRFNSARFGLFDLNSGTYLFKKNDFSFFPIEQRLYKILKKGINNPVSKKELEQGVLLDLIESNILIPEK